jgi:CheY-like chemotaxis protein
LIADDEIEVRQPVANLLRRAGFECQEAESGEEALRLLQARPFDAVILDIHMPGNAELETTTRLRTVAPGLPIVLMTGKPTVQTAARAVRLPVTAYLTKPPEIDELVRILDESIGDYRRFAAVSTGRKRLKEWDAELEDIQRVISTPGSDDANALHNFQRLTLRQVILMLSDLEQALALAGTGAHGETDRAAALLETVRVLERTKQNFKSRELADLRKRLQALIEPAD